jgi:hypothetical protein
VSTNLQIVTSALRMLAVLDATETPSAEDGALGLEQLNDLMALLAADNIDLGFPAQDSLADDFPLDDTVAAQVKPLLAAKLHAFYPSASPPPSLSGQAALAVSQLRRAAVLENIEEADLRHVPLGEWNRGGSDIINDE